ncbi:hypothetical protein M5689_012514 [Euphorbia peplus]|nr:hypothetical protein M5689_012514 [Euphorbia peplus]
MSFCSKIGEAQQKKKKMITAVLQNQLAPILKTNFVEHAKKINNLILIWPMFQKRTTLETQKRLIDGLG